LRLLGQANVSLQEAGGIIIARPASALLEPYKRVTVQDMRCRMQAAQLQALIDAAGQYLRRGYPPADLTPLAAQERGLLPRNWLRPTDSAALTGEGLYLGPWQESEVEAGVRTSPACASQLLTRYGARASEAYFPNHHRLVKGVAAAGTKEDKLILIFDDHFLVSGTRGANPADPL
jgi:hypothetical protein